MHILLAKGLPLLVRHHPHIKRWNQHNARTLFEITLKTTDFPNQTLNKHLHNDRFFQLQMWLNLRSVTEKCKLPSNTCKTFFITKIIEFINLQKIFHDPLKVLALMVIKLVLIFLQLSIIKINQFTLEYLIFINFCLTWVFITDIFKTTLSFMRCWRIWIYWSTP